MSTSATSSASATNSSSEDFETSASCNVSNDSYDVPAASSMEYQLVQVPEAVAAEAAVIHCPIRDNDHASNVSNDNILDDINDDEASNNNPIDNETTRRDTKRVLYLKILVILTLVVSGTIISFVVYNYVTASETEQFQFKFQNDATKIFAAVCGRLEGTLGALNAVTVSLVSYSTHQENEWPYVTVPDFALHASKILPITDGVYVAVVPIVQPPQKQKWEEYAYQNDYWVNESLALQEVWNGYHGEITYNWTRNMNIYGAFGDVESNVSRYMLPQWQSFPVATPEDGHKLYNWDWNSLLYPESIQTCIELQQAVLSETYMLPIPGDDIANAEMEVWADFFSSYLPSHEKVFEPMIDVYYPIINDLSSNAVVEGGRNSSSYTTVGMLVVPIYWRSFLRNILVEGSDGVVVVVHNPCNQPFTYQINGPQIIYLGVGDLHDTKYDDIVVISKISELKPYALGNTGYSGVPINTDYCPYTLYIYGSDMMKSDFISQDATLFLILIVLVFFVTSCAFIIYDCNVERRQHRVKSAAIYSSAIVSSLFPSSVRERLFPKPDASQKEKRRLSGFMLTDPIMPEIVNCETTTPIIGDPIAQVYLETTVIFADIVGFTSWSSSRDPIQVFHLLETVYAGFDALAKIHGVFKIETIGDSYVAVVGLPKSQTRHAVIMTRFAFAMRAKMKSLTNELEKTLGPGTSNLSLRIGLNSGPTIAGVLRGEKARFQLFGDTVNTAARMESNGKPYKIHISESTAHLLKLAGKEHWLTARNEMIVAKGKGNMQTYWCEPNTECSSKIRNTNDRCEL